MSDAPVAREAADEAADAHAIDVTDVWTRGKRALHAFAHREPAPEKPQDEGFLERIRGAGKRLVG